MPTELIVIDPDDGEAVQRVARALTAAVCKMDPDWDRAIAYEISAHMRDALRAGGQVSSPHDETRKHERR
jgi:hypothetical protein